MSNKKARKLLDIEGIRVDQKAFEKFTKKINILDMRVVNGKLVIKYTAKGIENGEVIFNNLNEKGD